MLTNGKLTYYKNDKVKTVTFSFTLVRQNCECNKIVFVDPVLYY